MSQLNNKLLFALFACISTISAPGDVSANAVQATVTTTDSTQALQRIHNMRQHKIFLDIARASQIVATQVLEQSMTMPEHKRLLETLLESVLANQRLSTHALACLVTSYQNDILPLMNEAHRNFEETYCNFKLIAIAAKIIEEQLPEVTQWFDNFSKAEPKKHYQFSIRYESDDKKWRLGANFSIIGYTRSTSTEIIAATASQKTEETYYIIQCNDTRHLPETYTNEYSEPNGWKMPDHTKSYQIQTSTHDIEKKFLVQDAEKYLICPNIELLERGPYDSSVLQKLLDPNQHLRIFKIVDAQTEA